MSNAAIAFADGINLSAWVGRHGEINAAGSVRCNMTPIANGYSGASQSFFIAQLTVLVIVGLSRTSPLDVFLMTRPEAPAHGASFSVRTYEKRPRPSPTWGGALGAALLQRAPVNIAKQAYGLWDH